MRTAMNRRHAETAAIKMQKALAQGYSRRWQTARALIHEVEAELRAIQPCSLNEELALSAVKWAIKANWTARENEEAAHDAAHRAMARVADVLIQRIATRRPAVSPADPRQVELLAEGIRNAILFTEGHGQARLGDQAIRLTMKAARKFANLAAEQGIDITAHPGPAKYGHDLWLSVQGHGSGFCDWSDWRADVLMEIVDPDMRFMSHWYSEEKDGDDGTLVEICG